MAESAAPKAKDDKSKAGFAAEPKADANAPKAGFTAKGDESKDEPKFGLMADEPDEGVEDDDEGEPGEEAPESPAEGNPAGDPLDESPVEPAEGVEDEPAAVGPTPGLSETDASGEALTPAQIARIQGTVLDGANGAAIRGQVATEEVATQESEEK
jgi:hypothetical protein